MLKRACFTWYPPGRDWHKSKMPPAGGIAGTKTEYPDWNKNVYKGLNYHFTNTLKVYQLNE